MNNSLSQQAAVVALKCKAHQFRNEAGDQSIREYLVRWVWEHSIRNRIHCNYVQLLCALMERLLVRLGNSAGRSIHALRPEVFADYVRHRRCERYATATVNTEVIYLMKIGRDVELLTGVNAGAGLGQEQKTHLERLPFSIEELEQILAAASTWGELGDQWQTFIRLMVYTSLRPADAASVRRKDIDLDRHIIQIKDGKTRRHRNGQPNLRPLHESLVKYLAALFAAKPGQPGDFLCPLLASRDRHLLAAKFNQLLNQAGIDRQAVRTGRNQIFCGKSLYSFRHTFRVLFQAAGATLEQAKLEMGQTSNSASRHYEHDADSRLMELRRKYLDRLPDVWSHRPNHG
jgi:integrase